VAEAPALPTAALCAEEVSMSEALFTLVQRAKRSDWVERLARSAFGGHDAARRAIDDMARADEAARVALQAGLLQRVLERARCTRHGRGRTLELSQWPVTTKGQLRERPQDFVVGARWLRIPAATSGTTGQPLRVWRGLGSVRAEQVFLDHLASCAGLRFERARLAVLRGNAPKGSGPFEMPVAERVGGRRLWLSPSRLSAATLDEYLAELRAFAPEMLWVYPTGGDRLASLCIDHGQRLPVKLVMSSSEMLSDAAMQRMQQAFCAPVVDYYGQAERVCMAVRREVGACWFEPAYGHVELRPAVLEGAAAGTAHACVVATGFWNDAMPLVRYDTGDLIEYDTAYGPRELERVALGLLPFTRVVGREPGFLLTPDGAHIQGLTAIVGNASRVRNAQFVQAADYSVEIRVVPESGFSSRDEAALIERARQRIPSSVAVRVRTVDSLQTASSGKVPFVWRDRTLSDAR
jgi:phenylacetate-CoA ligase